MLRPARPSLRRAARAAALLTPVTLLVSAPAARAQFDVRVAYNAGTLNTINDGENAFLAPGATISSFAPYSVIDFRGIGGNGGFNINNPFPDDRNFTDDFALEALARLTFNLTGDYVLRVNSDDGFRIRFGVGPDGSGGTTYSEFLGTRSLEDTDGPAFAFAAGAVRDLRLTFFERGGDEGVELSYSRNGGAFQLVGSTSEITVSAIPSAAAPEPGSLCLLGGIGGTAALSALRRRRRAA